MSHRYRRIILNAACGLAAGTCTLLCSCGQREADATAKTPPVPPAAVPAPTPQPAAPPAPGPPAATKAPAPKPAARALPPMPAASTVAPAPPGAADADAKTGLAAILDERSKVAKQVAGARAEARARQSAPPAPMPEAQPSSLVQRNPFLQAAKSAAIRPAAAAPTMPSPAAAAPAAAAPGRTPTETTPTPAPPSAIPPPAGPVDIAELAAMAVEPGPDGAATADARARRCCRSLARHPLSTYAMKSLGSVLPYVEDPDTRAQCWAVYGLGLLRGGWERDLAKVRATLEHKTPGSPYLELFTPATLGGGDDEALSKDKIDQVYRDLLEQARSGNNGH